MGLNTINKPVRILVSAINGYGYYYLKALREEVREGEAVLVGVVDPEAYRSEHFQWITEQKIPVFDRIEDFFNTGFEADLSVISSPPQYHVPQSLVALSHGSNVLVDKPVGVGVDSVRELIRVSGKFERWVEVGYQWSFSNAIKNLKKDILGGVYGQPVRFKSICLWPRDFNYYNRNNWAGKIRDNQGLLVLDSPANNACAHFLHNLLYLLGKEMNTSAFAGYIESSKYRAYEIENYDTITVKLRIESDVEVLFYASHVSEIERNPEFLLEFKGGEVMFGGDLKSIIGKDKEGLTRDYGSPDDHQFKKLIDSISRVRHPGPAICPPVAAMAQTMCIDMIQSSGSSVENFKSGYIVDNGQRRYVMGLNEVFNEAYDSGKMLSDYKL